MKKIIVVFTLLTCSALLPSGGKHQKTLVPSSEPNPYETRLTNLGTTFSGTAEFMATAGKQIEEMSKTIAELTPLKAYLSTVFPENQGGDESQATETSSPDQESRVWQTGVEEHLNTIDAAIQLIRHEHDQHGKEATTQKQIIEAHKQEFDDFYCWGHKLQKDFETFSQQTTQELAAVRAESAQDRQQLIERLTTVEGAHIKTASCVALQETALTGLTTRLALAETKLGNIRPSTTTTSAPTSAVASTKNPNSTAVNERFDKQQAEIDKLKLTQQRMLIAAGFTASALTTYWLTRTETGKSLLHKGYRGAVNSTLLVTASIGTAATALKNVVPTFKLPVFGKNSASVTSSGVTPTTTAVIPSATPSDLHSTAAAIIPVVTSTPPASPVA